MLCTYIWSPPPPADWIHALSISSLQYLNICGSVGCSYMYVVIYYLYLFWVEFKLCMYYFVFIWMIIEWGLMDLLVIL